MNQRTSTRNKPLVSLLRNKSGNYYNTWKSHRSSIAIAPSVAENSAEAKESSGRKAAVSVISASVQRSHVGKSATVRQHLFRKNKTMKNASVIHVEPDGITIKFSGGISKIPCEEITKAD